MPAIIRMLRKLKTCYYASQIEEAIKESIEFKTSGNIIGVILFRSKRIPAKNIPRELFNQLSMKEFLAVVCKASVFSKCIFIF